LRNPIRGATVAGQVRSLLDYGAAGSLSDGALLERFAGREGAPSEAAFAALVERHGPMVLRACRSILRDPHRAQDAFQSTFLLLARRAGSLWVRDSIAPWLHSVACRVASGARAADGRRRALERRAASALASRSPDEPSRDDLGPALHEEIERLPDRLKAPVVLCYLQGLTHDQAAEHLACPVGTVRSRLAQGRDRLRRGLSRRGFAPPPPIDDHRPASVPASLATLTIHAAGQTSGRSTIGPLASWFISTSEGVLKAMMIHPLKSAAVLLLAGGAIAVGLGATSGQEPKPPEKPASPAEARDLSAIDRRFEAIERRLRDLETRLDEVASPRRSVARNVPVDPDTARKIRPRFDNVLVEKVFVVAGQPVKKGDPLLIIRSADLGQARNDCRTNYVQWDHNHKFLVAREPLAKEGRITQIIWTETVTGEKQSRLSYLVSREKLLSYGMTNEQIDQLLEGLGDDHKKAVEADDKTEDITRMTMVSPIDGIVVERAVAPGNFYDQADNLFLIAPSKP
jgi:RNA polymerase sigma factor (sigma-70 family)